MKRPVGRPKTDLKTRLLEKLYWEDRGYKTKCWIWPITNGGTGRPIIQVNRKSLRTYRVVYEMLVGPIPEGLTLDHLCRVPTCCNPEHLEPVTLEENLARTRGEFCKSGEHAMSGSNLLQYYWQGKLTRRCKACKEKYDKKPKTARHELAETVYNL